MNSTPEMGYRRVIGATRCSNGLRGFRLNIRRFSIQKLRVRFVHFFKVLFKWRKSYDRAIRSFKKGISGAKRSSSNNNIGCNNNNHNRSNSRLIGQERKGDCRLRSLGRTNSFYSEAIADCLEFIKRNSISVDNMSDVVDDDDDEAAPIAVTRR